MGTVSVLNGEAVVCGHAWSLFKMVSAVSGWSESEVIERALNDYAHSWYQEHEVPLDSNLTSLETAVRNWCVGGSDDR